MSRVYFLHGGDAIKIGFSTDLNKRIRVLGFGSPVKLKLLGSVEASASFERALHSKLSEHRINGEWFADVPAVRVIVDSVLAHGISAIGYHEPAAAISDQEPTEVAARSETFEPSDFWIGIIRQAKRIFFEDYIVAVARAPKDVAAAMVAALRGALDDLEKMMDARSLQEQADERIQSLAAELAALSLHGIRRTPDSAVD